MCAYSGTVVLRRALSGLYLLPLRAEPCQQPTLHEHIDFVLTVLPHSFTSMTVSYEKNRLLAFFAGSGNALLRDGPWI